jgi:hypothetical protein
MSDKSRREQTADQPKNDLADKVGDKIEEAHKPLGPVVAVGQRRTTKDGFLVELTGIEPVASWLQTRRSPS